MKLAATLIAVIAYGTAAFAVYALIVALLGPLAR